MTCKEIRALSDEWIHGSLSESVRNEVREHRCSCASCEAFYSSEEALSRLLGSSSPEPSCSVSSSVLSAIRKEKRAEAQKRMRSFTGYASAAAMLVLVVGITAAFASGFFDPGKAVTGDPVSSGVTEKQYPEATEQEQSGSIGFYFSGYSESSGILPENSGVFDELGIAARDFEDATVYLIPEERKEEFFLLSGLDESDLSGIGSMPEGYEDILKVLSPQAGDFVVFVKK